MAPAADLPPDPPPATAAGAASVPARRAVLGDNPMQTVLAAAVVALLVFSLTSNRSRIDRLEDTVAAGFAAQDARFDDLDDRIDDLDDRIDELDLKLTALIAALNKSDEVDGAIEGRLLTPGAAGATP